MRQLTVIAVVFVFATANAYASPVVLRTVSQDNAVVKYNPADPSKPGICQEILQAIERADPSIKFSGWKFKTPIARIELMLEFNEVDVYFCLVKSPERAKKFGYVDIPLYTIKHVVAVRADDPVDVKSFDDIRKLGADGVVLVSLGSALVKVLKDEHLRIDDGAKTDEQNFSKLLASRGRFFYGQDMTFFNSIRDLKLTGKVKILDAVFKEEAQYLTVSKSLDPSVVEKLKAHIEKMQKRGELQRIADKYK